MSVNRSELWTRAYLAALAGSRASSPEDAADYFLQLYDERFKPKVVPDLWHPVLECIEREWPEAHAELVDFPPDYLRKVLKTMRYLHGEEHLAEYSGCLNVVRHIKSTNKSAEFLNRIRELKGRR